MRKSSGNNYFGKSVAGDIAHVDVLKNPDGRSKGCAVVYFDHPDDAEKAIGMLRILEYSEWNLAYPNRLLRLSSLENGVL